MKRKVQNKHKEKVNNIKSPLFFVILSNNMITNISVFSFSQTMSIISIIFFFF